MKTIHKYTLDPRDETTFKVPAGAEVLCLRVQFGNPSIWMRVDEAAPIVERTFMVLGTGHNADAAGAYVGTVLMRDGALVFHVFEKA